MKINTFKQFLNESNTDKLRSYLEENWEDIYNKTHGKEITIIIYGKKVDVMGERWGDECIEDYLQKTSDDEIDYDNLENYLDDAIQHVKHTEKWDGYVYIDSHISQEQYGVTIFYRVK